LSHLIFRVARVGIGFDPGGGGDKWGIIGVGESEPIFSKEQKYKQDNNLVDAMAKDVSPHNFVYDPLKFASGLSVK